MVCQTLRETLVHGIQELYSAEQQQVRLLRRLVRAASSSDLRDALSLHHKETVHQVRRLERAFSMLDEPIRWTRCPGILGIVEECEEALEGATPGPLRDAALIAAVQRIEHYEMAAYGTVAAWAEALGLGAIGEVLNESLDEEVTTADLLLSVGLGEVHAAAARAARPLRAFPSMAAERL